MARGQAAAAVDPVEHYTGWAAVKKAAPDADGEWHFMQNAVRHNEGEILPILKLGLIDDRTGETIVYSWAEPGAERIVINTRQIQVGLTRQTLVLPRRRE